MYLEVGRRCPEVCLFFAQLPGGCLRFLFINDFLNHFIWYLSTLTHLMVHPAYSQQVVIIKAPVIVRLNRYGMMDGQVLIVVLPVCAVKVTNAHLAEILVPPAYLLPFPPPHPGAAESVYVGYPLLRLWLPAAVILAVMDAAAVFTRLKHLYHLTSTHI